MTNLRESPGSSRPVPKEGPLTLQLWLCPSPCALPTESRQMDPFPGVRTEEQRVGPGARAMGPGSHGGVSMRLRGTPQFKHRRTPALCLPGCPAHQRGLWSWAGHRKGHGRPCRKSTKRRLVCDPPGTSRPDVSARLCPESLGPGRDGNSCRTWAWVRDNSVNKSQAGFSAVTMAMT